MPAFQNISIKGKNSVLNYEYSLKDAFYNLGTSISVSKSLQLLKQEGLNMTKAQLSKKLFSYRKPSRIVNNDFSFAGPFQMKSVLNSLFGFNLVYQDVVIRIELEKLVLDVEDQRLTLDNYKSTYLRIIKITSIILKTSFFDNSPLYLELTNSELDIIVIKILALVIYNQLDISEEGSGLLHSGFIANEMATSVQKHIYHNEMEISEIIQYAIASGVIWWSAPKLQDKYFEDANRTINQLLVDLKLQAGKKLVINDFKKFSNEVLTSKKKTKIIYFLDDNGELVWHLLLIKEIIKKNPEIFVTAVLNSIPVTNNANSITASQIIQANPILYNLYSNPQFRLLHEENELPAIDLRFSSSRLLKNLKNSDFAIVNGVSFFEKMQNLPVPVYYLFTVYSHTSTILTGLHKSDGIFARCPENTIAFGGFKEDLDSVLVEWDLIKSHERFKRAT